MLKFTPGNPNWTAEHVRIYLETDGREGHLVDMSEMGGNEATPTMLLKTIGRKSGRDRIIPLAYFRFGDEYAFMAAKAGAPNHPGWFLNLQAADQVNFQVGRDHLRGTWRIAEGAERERLWQEMAKVYPIYDDYKTKTDRVIPIVLLKPVSAPESL